MSLNISRSFIDAAQSRTRFWERFKPVPREIRFPSVTDILRTATPNDLRFIIEQMPSHQFAARLMESNDPRLVERVLRDLKEHDQYSRDVCISLYDHYVDFYNKHGRCFSDSIGIILSEKYFHQLIPQENERLKVRNRAEWDQRLSSRDLSDYPQLKENILANNNIEFLRNMLRVRIELIFNSHTGHWAPFEKMLPHQILLGFGKNPDVYDIAHFFLVEEGFSKDKHLAVDIAQVLHPGVNYSKYDPLLEKISWLNTGLGKRVKTIIDGYMRHIVDEVFPKFRILEKNKKLLAEYGALFFDEYYLKTKIPISALPDPQVSAKRLKMGDVLTHPSKSVEQIFICGFMAEGGMSDIYNASFTGHVSGKYNKSTSVVVKVFRPDPSDTLANIQEQRRMFLNEARIMLKVGGSDLLFADAAEDQGRLFFVMKCYASETMLDEFGSMGMPKQPQEFIRRLDYALKTAKNLKTIHDKGAVHKDLKPQNIMNGIPIDYGIARLLGEVDTKGTYGTQGCAPPEQYNPSAILDIRTDIYAYGALMYWLFTGDVLINEDGMLLFAPTARATADMKTRCLKKNDWVSPISANPDIPEGIDYVIRRAMQTRIEDRYNNLGEVIGDLSHIISEITTGRTDFEFMSSEFKGSGDMRALWMDILVYFGLKDERITRLSTEDLIPELNKLLCDPGFYWRLKNIEGGEGIKKVVMGRLITERHRYLADSEYPSTETYQSKRLTQEFNRELFRIISPRNFPKK